MQQLKSFGANAEHLPVKRKSAANFRYRNQIQSLSMSPVSSPVGTSRKTPVPVIIDFCRPFVFGSSSSSVSANFALTFDVSGYTNRLVFDQRRLCPKSELQSASALFCLYYDRKIATQRYPFYDSCLCAHRPADLFIGSFLSCALEFSKSFCCFAAKPVMKLSFLVNQIRARLS